MQQRVRWSVDLSEHLDMDRFEHGTKILALGELRETPLFDDILNELFQASRSDLEYQEISDNDYRKIEEHVRTSVRTFDPDAPEWAAQVESVVDEVVEMYDPNDPREQLVISEWVRSMAKDEADD
jgi:hypothetical protein